MASRESTRLTMQRLAATVDAVRAELETLPAATAVYEIRRTLTAAVGQFRALHAMTPDPTPRTREPKRG